MKKKYSIVKSGVTQAFILNFICAFIAILPFIIKNHGLFTLSNDFCAQELSFNMFANTAIKKGDVLWNWNIDIGSDFVSTFSFYNLGSPFFWISLLFPAKLFPYLVGWLYMLKYAVAGATSYLYINRFAEKKNWAIVASMLYAFSGFQSCNLVFYHFHDAVALFPLLLWGLEKKIVDGKKGIFTIVVAINALVNYVFFIGEVLFIVIYYCIRFLSREKKKLLKIPSCMAEGILGIGISSVLFLPSCISVLNNQRVSNRLSGKSMFIFYWKDYLLNLKGLLFPGDNMAHTSSVVDYNWYSVSAWLAMVGIVLVIAYCIYDKKSWLTRLLILCLVFAFVPILNNSFVMFNVEPYRRWYYMPILLMVLASEKMMEKPYKKGIKIGFGIVTLLILCYMIVVWKYASVHQDNTFLSRPFVFCVFCGIALFGACGTYIFSRISIERKRIYCYSVGIFLTAIITTSGAIYLYHKGADQPSSDAVYSDVVLTGSALDTDILPYRYRFWENYYNRGMAAYLPTRNSFCTTVSPSIVEFYDALGAPRHTIGVDGPVGTDQLLGVGYQVDNYEYDGKKIDSFDNGWQTINVYDVRSLPVGFAYDSYMLASEFQKLDSEVRAAGMLKNLVIDDTDEKKVKKRLKHSEVESGTVSVEEIPQYVQSHTEKIYDFQKTAKTFSAKIDVSKDKYVFFSVPYDKQWSAVVNGESCEILNINGLMAVPVTKGENTIQFVYSAIWLKLGCIISIVCLGIWILVFWVSKKKSKQ